MLVAISLPLSHIGMSIAQFGFGVAVFGGLHYREKLKRLSSNTTSMMWIGLFVLFLLGGFHSTDQVYFWRDIRMKMPIWVFATAIGCMPLLSRIKFSAVLHFFLIGIYIHILLGVYVLLSGSSNGAEYRDLSPMVSHIRMGLFLVTGIIIQFFLLFKANKDLHFFNKWMYVFGILLFFAWLFIIKSLTAIGILFVVLLVAGPWFAARMRNRKKAWLLSAICWLPIVVCGVFIAYYTYAFFDREMPIISQTPEYTEEGCLYVSEPNQGFYENGRYVYDKYCMGEMAREWEKRSDVSFFEDHLKVHYTLLRYLTSRGYSKDAIGMQLLSDEDIRNVEKGIPNYRYNQLFGLRGRVYETLWELEIWYGSGDAEGKSLATRFELWQAAWRILKQNFYAGVGTGDVRMELQKSVYSDNKPIRYDKSFGAHNQFLTTGIALGFFGMIWMLFSLIQPLLEGVRYRPLMFFFIIVSLLCMLNEDVFETQAAVTFISFFFHLFNRPDRL